MNVYKFNKNWKKKKPNLKKGGKKQNKNNLTNPFQYAQLYKQLPHKSYRICLGKLSQMKHLKHFRPSSNNLSVCIQW